jgi:hypothetical protein
LSDVLSNREKLVALVSYLKGYQMTLIVSGMNSPKNTAKTMRLLHNRLVKKMNLDEENESFYKSIFSVIENIETMSHDSYKVFKN